MFIYGCPTTNKIKRDAGAHSTCITVPNTFYITSHDTGFHRKKYSPQMIHQLRPRFCQVKIKRELVVQTRHRLCRCAEMSTDTSFSTTANQGFCPWDHGHRLSVRIAVLVLVWPSQVFICLFMVLRIKPKASDTLVMHSTIELYPQTS